MGADHASEPPAPTFRGQDDKTRFERALQAFAQTKLGGRLFITVFPAIDRRLMPLTRGRLRTGLGQPMILLHCRGAKSGQPRTTPLLYTPRGEGLVLVASKAGAKCHPAWYHNVIAHPDVEADLDGRRRAMSATSCGGWSTTTTAAMRPTSAVPASVASRSSCSSREGTPPPHRADRRRPLRCRECRCPPPRTRARRERPRGRRPQQALSHGHRRPAGRVIADRGG